MSLVAQTAILLSVCLAAEGAVRLFRLPVPGNVLGMALLFVLLCTKVIKPSQIRRVSDILLSHMTFFFIPGAAALMIHYRAVSGHWPGFLGVVVVSTLVIFVVTGRLAQRLFRGKRRE